MNKSVLRLLSLGLAATTLCNASNISAANGNKKELPTAAKVCIGMGAGAAVLLGSSLIFYAASQENKTEGSDITSYNLGNSRKTSNVELGRGASVGISYTSSITNANLTNVSNLCFWHSLIQQLYSLKSFRAFVNDTNLSSYVKNDADGTVAKIVALRDFFRKMDKQDSVGRDECVDFARSLLRSFYDQRQHDIHEVLTLFIGDVMDAYNEFCEKRFHVANGLQRSNIFGEPYKIESENLKLEDLLKVSSGCVEEKMQELFELMLDSQTRDQIIRDYLKEICVEGTEVPNSVTVNDVANYLGCIKPGCVEEAQYLQNYLLGQSNEEFVNDVISKLENRVDCVRQAVLRAYASKGLIDVPVIDGQFVLFVNRVVNGVAKNSTHIDFGNGIVRYKGADYKLTAVSVHKGSSICGGHYCTYKKEKDGEWYCYDDLCGSAEKVTFEFVKNTAQRQCTMMTFSRV